MSPALCQPVIPAVEQEAGAALDVPFPPLGQVCQPLQGTRLGEGRDSWDTELVQCLLLHFWSSMLNLGSEPLFQQLSLWLI